MYKTFFKSDMYPKKEKVLKPIPKISKKKQERIKEFGSEKDLFLEIWNEREHICTDCGYVLTTPRAHNFDHIVSKGVDKKKRMDKENIAILCFSCHFQKTSGLNYLGPDLDIG